MIRHRFILVVSNLENSNINIMVLYRLKDFDPKYQDAVGRDEIVGLDVYADIDEDFNSFLFSLL